MNTKLGSGADSAVYSWLAVQLLAYEASEPIRSSAVQADAQVVVRAYALNAQPAVVPS